MTSFHARKFHCLVLRTGLNVLRSSLYLYLICFELPTTSELKLNYYIHNCDSPQHMYFIRLELPTELKAL